MKKFNNFYLLNVIYDEYNKEKCLNEEKYNFLNSNNYLKNNTILDQTNKISNSLLSKKIQKTVRSGRQKKEEGTTRRRGKGF